MITLCSYIFVEIRYHLNSAAETLNRGLVAALTKKIATVCRDLPAPVTVQNKLSQ